MTVKEITAYEVSRKGIKKRKLVYLWMYEMKVILMIGK